MRRKPKSMAYERKKPRWPWRDYLTTDETLIVNKIDRAEHKTAEQQVTLIRIRNRALQRAKYAHTRDT